MTRLILVRHGHAGAAVPGAQDRDRPLSAEGRQAVTALARRLRAEGLDARTHVLCSPARRTRETLELVLPDAASVASDEALYLADGPTLLKQLRYIETPADMAMVVGHNPGLQELAVGLAGGPATPSGRALAREFPAAAAAIFTVAQPWSRLGLEVLPLLAFYSPQILGNEP